VTGLVVRNSTDKCGREEGEGTGEGGNDAVEPAMEKKKDKRGRWAAGHLTDTREREGGKKPKVGERIF